MQLLWIIAVVTLLECPKLFYAYEEEFGETGICTSDRFGVATSINAFGFSLARGLEEQSENQFFSPLSLSMSLGMAQLGARGETAEQIEKVLNYKGMNISDDEVHEQICKLNDDISARTNSSYNINLANALFSQLDLQISEEYETDLRRYYHASSVRVDFSNDAVSTLNTINNWVRDNTFGKINSIVEQPLPMDSKLFLTNAVYFKGSWKVQFPIERTTDSYFYVAGEDREVVVPLMTLVEETFRYSRDEKLGYKFLELPYKGEEISMMFALPLKYDQVPNIRMTTDLFCRIRSNMSKTELDIVAIPRFRINCKHNMKHVLVSLGMANAFAAGAADFSGIKPDQGIYISDVLHNAVIDVNEEGSEAAAVSGLVFRPVSANLVDDLR